MTHSTGTQEECYVIGAKATSFLRCVPSFQVIQSKRFGDERKRRHLSSFILGFYDSRPNTHRPVSSILSLSLFSISWAPYAVTHSHTHSTDKIELPSQTHTRIQPFFFLPPFGPYH